MRYYVIINGVNSLTIEGLAIRTLPPISKPAMRNLREEIDGRDGDITTELGYGAYDRPLEIGLYGDYDINKIIAFFNSKGKIIFSDEPDKYYNFEIVDKIDYTKLVKFRTATINIHCQPFKYPVSEEPQVEKFEYVTGTGTNVTLDNTSEAIFNKFDLLGNTSQDGTPTPSSPIPVNVVSGDNEINICGKNLCPNDFTNGAFNNNTGLIQVHDNNHISYEDFIPVAPSSQYYIKHNHTISGTGSTAIFEYDKNKSFIQRIGVSYTNQGTFTTSSTTQYINIGIYDNGGASLSGFECQVEKGSTPSTYEPYIGNSYPLYLGVENLFDGVFRQGTHVNTSTANCLCSDNEMKSVSGKQYTFYTNLPNTFKYKIMNCTANGTSTTVIDDTNYSTSGSVSVNCTADGYLKILVKKNDDSNLTPSTIIGYTFQVGIGTNHISNQPIELCKIGTYQDYIYKDNGSWYLHKEIGKVVLDGTETWTYWSGGPYFYNTTIFADYPRSTSKTYIDFVSNMYVNDKRVSPNPNVDNSMAIVWQPDRSSEINIRNTSYTTATDFKTWLSTHNTSVYYALATPTDTLIEDTTLIEQLEALRNAESYEGQTNITQTNNDAPFILDLSALKEGSDHLVINNAGNIYAKPTMDIEGTGVVDIYLNDVQILEADLTETNNIVIDTEAMEAYNPDTNALANRQITGDYSKIKLEPGENDLRFSGDLSKATITDYTRWL